MNEIPPPIPSNGPLALWHVAPRRSELRPAAMGEGEALLAARWSLISRGTERLVFEGRVPDGERARMRAPFQEGEFPFPVKYGYAAVAEVLEGPRDLVGRHVFALHPHQTRFRLPVEALIPVPDAVPPRRAALAANMETALNAIWDAGAGPGDRIAVIGGGLVGLLVARLAARIAGTETTVRDVAAERRETCAALSVSFADRQIAGHGFDMAFHTSASAAGLAEAVSCLGPEGRLIELSWYGEGAVAAPLGGAFHSQRLTLISSQVGQVSPSRRPRWSYRRRLEKAMALLDDPALDALIDAEVAFGDLSARLPAILAPGAPGIATVIRYE